MLVLVACEFSGTVRRAFRALGHDAYSCDLRPGYGNREHHFRQDVRPLLKGGWDLVIAHPPCTYLCNSGVRWLHERKGRWALMEAAALFFRECLAANAPRVCVENPVMHGYARELIGRTPSQTVQPYQFGHEESKATCLYLKGLPPLTPTEVVTEGCRTDRIHRMGGFDRAAKRSLTFTGIAEAMAEQWGGLNGD